METPQYILSQILKGGHTEDAKSVFFVGGGRLVSASRDRLLILWNSSGGEDGVAVPEHTWTDSTAYINSVTKIAPALDESGPPLIASGGSDTCIRIHRAGGDYALVTTLDGHNSNVCCLSPVPGRPMGLISGSWDCSAKVWDSGRCVFTLRGHAQAVWAVAASSSNDFITGSADKSIRIWHMDQQVHTLIGHKDVVRGIAMLAPAEDGSTAAGPFVSCSNDATLALWPSLKSDRPVACMHGHTSFVYSVAASSPSKTNEQLVFSCGEDRTLRVWQKSGIIVQTLALPVTSVWSVACDTETDDIAAACSDGNIYIFTRDAKRSAQPDMLAEFENTLASAAIPRNQVGDLKTDTLVRPEVLKEPGTTEGQIKLIRNEFGGAEAHQWSVSGDRWIKVGDVVDAVGSSRKQLYNGIEYDYVFDIDVGDGVGMLKLPYNATENPYMVAKRFLEQNKLEASFLDQVADFITENTRGQSLSMGPDVPSDPYTGESRYRPKFDGGFPAAATTPAQKPRPASSLPMRAYVLFKQPLDAAAVDRKISQIASEAQLPLPRSLVAAAASTSGVANGYAESSFAVASSILHDAKWPKTSVYPALDLIRLYLLDAEPDESASILQTVLSLLIYGGSGSGSSNSSDPNAIVGFRVLANFFACPKNRETVTRLDLLHVLEKLNDFRASENKAIRLGVVTVLLNLAVYTLLTGDVSELTLNLVAVLAEVIATEKDPENLFRAVVAVGTLATIGGTVKTYLVALEIALTLRKIAGDNNEDRIKYAAQDSLCYF